MRGAGAETVAIAASSVSRGEAPSEGTTALEDRARSARLRALVELHVVPVRVAQEGAPHPTAGRLAVGERVGDARLEEHLEAAGARARDDRVDLLHPEAEVVDPGLEEAGRLAVRFDRERLVEHDERFPRSLAPAEVDGSALARSLSRQARELLDRAELHAQPDRGAVEAQRALHLAHADRQV